VYPGVVEGATMRLLRLVLPALVVAGLVVVAPAASAVPYRQNFGEDFYGAFSVTDPECNAAGVALVNRGRSDFYRCIEVTPDQVEELAGYVITG
jgi:hypothetical protein